MKKLTPKEEDILSYFWTNGPLFIRELLELQEEPKPHYNAFHDRTRAGGERLYRVSPVWKHLSVLCIGLGGRIPEQDAEKRGKPLFRRFLYACRFFADRP